MWFSLVVDMGRKYRAMKLKCSDHTKFYIHKGWAAMASTKFAVISWPGERMKRCVNWILHDDVIKWKHFPRYWPFCVGNSPVTGGQWRGALMFSLICAWINRSVNNREAGDLRLYRAHYDVIVMNYEWEIVGRMNSLVIGLIWNVWDMWNKPCI